VDVDAELDFCATEKVKGNDGAENHESRNPESGRRSLLGKAEPIER